MDNVGDQRSGGPTEAQPSHRAAQSLPWLIGLVGGLAVLGPALRGGSLLSLDLVVTPRIPVPSGMWGLGPELPRRVPFTAPLAWASTVIGGMNAWNLVALAALMTAAAGVWKLAAQAPTLCRAGAAAGYALSPFVLTRLGVGQLSFVAAVAILPWAIPTLLQPDRDLGRTLLWASALGCTGEFGLIAGFAVLIGLIAGRGRRGLLVVGSYLAGQLPWLVPGAIALAQPLRLARPSEFATKASSLGGVLRVLAGYGFWQPHLQAGPTGGAGWEVALAGVALAGLAIVGSRQLPKPWGTRLVALGAVGLGLALASALPGVRVLYTAATNTPIGAPFRESQRFLALYLVWMAPAAALGAGRIARRFRLLDGLVDAVPLAIALLLAGPALFGINGRLDPVTFPREWRRARDVVQRNPGTVLSLPWHEYLQLRIADNRNVFNPVPIYFGGDVLSSSDPEFLSGPEQSEPREPATKTILARIRAGDAVGPALARLGVRWVVLLHDVDWQSYQALDHDPGLQRAVGGSSLDLFRVRTWRGPVITERGRVVTLQTIVQPFGWLDASPAATWFRPSANGWMRGLTPARSTRNGLLRLPPGRGPVWYWPAVVVLGGDLTTAGLVIGIVVSRRARRPVRLDNTDHPQ